MENKNNILIILVVSLILIVIGLTGFIVYDKVLSNGSYAGGSDNSSENDYKVFVKNVKSNMAKHESNSYLSLLNTIIEDGYEVSLDENGSLFVRYYNEEINSRYGNYKIADNVLSFYVIRSGQGGGNSLYFINEDGTVGVAETEYEVAIANEININRDLGYKNIVTVLPSLFGEISGSLGPIFVDINGNMYSANFN